MEHFDILQGLLLVCRREVDGLCHAAAEQKTMLQTLKDVSYVIQFWI